MMNEKALCTARELAIGYGKTPLLSDICLGVQPGQILTLIGPNGAGKSTLLRTLAGQLAPMGGTVLLAGKDLTAYTGTQRAQKLALMAPHSRRMELTTCFDFVSAGRYPYTGRLGILSAEDRQQVHRALELVGAAHLADRDFNRISDGQRQRILLARALCQQPEVILLDEPTSFLDIKGKIELLTILKELAHTGQLAVILSLHELELAEKIADTVVCVSPAGVSGVLTPEQAFQPENIRTLYGLTEQQYTALFGTSEPEAEKAPAGKPQFEHYVRSGQKLLRCGYTTGTCAALGAAGAARLLLTGREPETVALRTPKGIVVEVAPLWCRSTDTGAACAIRKDGGDDVDVTTGLPVIASVVLEPGAPGVRILGGEGVGRVTKPGLDQPVGEAAINHVPRQMIAEALEREAENAAYTESNPTFTQKTIDAYKLTDLVKVSIELLDDSAFDLEEYIAREFAYAFGAAEEQAFCVGTGTGQPTGLFTTNGGTVGVTAASATTVTTDEVISLIYALKAPYRKNAKFLMNDATVSALRKLKDSNGQYLWQPSLQAGQPDRLLGYEIYTSPYAPTLAAGALSIAFGDFQSYWIADRTGRTVQRLNELYSTNGQVGFVATERVDGKIILPEGIQLLKMKAS